MIDPESATMMEPKAAHDETAPSERKMPEFETAIAKWRGSATARLKLFGFGSTDEFIAAIRGR